MNIIFCVFVATPVRITRLKQKQKMEQGQKMGHRELAALRGKNAEFISTSDKSRIDQDMSHLLLLKLLLSSRAPRKNFVEVTELTDITYMSNLVKLRPGQMNVVLLLTDTSKNVLLTKFAKEVYSFTG